MSKIRGKNTRPELIVRSYLHRNGLRFRIHDKNLPGKPDIILKKYRTVVFVNGCFWHSHEDCRYSVLPKTRTEWWGNKLGRTKERDRQAIEDLNEIGFKVITIWECMLKKDKKEETLENLVDEILNFNQ